MSVVVLYLLFSPFILYYFWLDFAAAVPACLFLFAFSNSKMGHSQVAAPITAPIKARSGMFDFRDYLGQEWFAIFFR